MSFLPDKFRSLVHAAGGAPVEDPLNTSNLHMPAALNLRPYQIEGANWLRRSERAILADDAGLGKTAQGGAAATRPVLVTCPTYVVLPWADYLAENYPNETVAIAGLGTRTQRHKALVGGDVTKIPDKAAADWTIVNTDMHRGYWLPEVATWIVDEMHHFRNKDAERSKLAHKYGQRIPYVYGMTATPVYKDVTNLWHLLHMLDPQTWSSYGDFVTRYAVTAGDQGWGANRVVGIRNPKSLEKAIAPYILRRTYKDVGLFLPDVIDNNVLLDFSAPELRLYKMVRDQYIYEDIRLESTSEVMHTLRRCTVGTKIDAAKQILEDHPQPTAIFCWYTDTVEDTARELGGVPITGAMDPDSRAPTAKKALSQGKPVVATIASLSEGIDLSMCKQIIQLEEDYVPGSMYQERRRFQRWTPDERPVLFHNLRVRNTIDMHVHHSVISRRGSAQLILKDALT